MFQKHRPGFSSREQTDSRDWKWFSGLSRVMYWSYATHLHGKKRMPSIEVDSEKQCKRTPAVASF